MLTKIPERFKSRVVLAPQATGTGTAEFLAPTPGAKSLTFRAIVTMGNAADLAISLQYADDTSGTNAAAYPVEVPIYVNGERQPNGKSHTVEDSTGEFIVDFVVDPATIPDGKTVGISYASSNAANLMAVELIEDAAYRPQSDE